MDMANGHGQWTWPMDMANGHFQWTFPMDISNIHGPCVPRSGAYFRPKVKPDGEEPEISSLLTQICTETSYKSNKNPQNIFL